MSKKPNFPNRDGAKSPLAPATSWGGDLLIGDPADMPDATGSARNGMQFPKFCHLRGAV